jgi:tungstate transport system ATP-binding protein
MSAGWSVNVERLELRLSESFRLSVPKLEIAAGETLAIVGPTGSGKSTLLKLLAGLVPPDRGAILLDKRSLTEPASRDELRRRIAWTPQSPLMLRGSVFRNVEYPLQFSRRRDPAESISVAKTALARFGLTELASQSARTLSGGQTQLTALARALAVAPALLLVDEPTANLDPARTALVERELAAQSQSGDTTIVWATHNLFQARRTADHVLLLLDGTPVEHAATEEFFTRPSDSRTADFIAGKMIY